LLRTVRSLFVRDDDDACAHITIERRLLWIFY
jgi:hypothetical protein